MQELIFKLIILIKEKNFREILLVCKKIRETCAKNKQELNNLTELLKNSDKTFENTLLELAFDSNCDETAYLIFSLYRDFVPDWPILTRSNKKPLILELLNTPEKKALLYSVVIDWMPRTVEKRVYERHLSAISSSIKGKGSLEIVTLNKLKNMPVASLIKCIAENKTKASIAFREDYLENISLQDIWKNYYEKLARAVSLNTQFVQKGDELTGHDLINKTIGLYFYNIYLNLLDYQQFFIDKSEGLDVFKPILDIALEALNKSSEYNSFFALQRLCLLKMKWLSNIKNSDEKVTPDNIKSIEELADKMLGHEAPGYLSAAFLYFAIAQHFENDASKADAYYLLAYYHLQVAMNVADMKEQLHNAYLGVDYFQFLPIDSVEEANNFLQRYLKTDTYIIDSVKAKAKSTAKELSRENEIFNKNKGDKQREAEIATDKALFAPEIAADKTLREIEMAMDKAKRETGTTSDKTLRETEMAIEKAECKTIPADAIKTDMKKGEDTTDSDDLKPPRTKSPLNRKFR